MMLLKHKHGRRGVGIIILLVLGFFGHRYYTQSDTHAENSANPSVPPATVPTVDPASVSTMVTDKETGKQFMSNQLIVEFTAGTLEQEANAVIESLNGKMVAHFTKAPLYLVQVKDSGDGIGARQALKKFQADTHVKTVDLNYLTTAPAPTSTTTN